MSVGALLWVSYDREILAGQSPVRFLRNTQRIPNQSNYRSCTYVQIKRPETCSIPIPGMPISNDQLSIILIILSELAKCRKGVLQGINS
jgi:hypothetical protein